MAAESAEAWARAFFDPGTGKVDEGSQTAQSFALGFGAAQSVKCSRRSIRGLIESNWTNSPEKTTFEFTILPDTQALVILPKREGETLTEGSMLIEESKELSIGSITPKSAGLFLLSGRYGFTFKK